MKGIITIVVAVCLTAIPLMGADRASEAAALYDKGDYSKALELYQALEKDKGTSAELYYNKGQCYVRVGDLGQAMLCYQRALRLDPSNGKARANMNYVASKVNDANKAELQGKKVSVSPDEPSFFGTLKYYITRRHLSDTWGWWAGVLFALSCVCAALYIFSRSVLIRKIGFFGGLSALGLSVIFLIFALTAATASERHDDGVVTAYKVQLKSEADAGSKKAGMPLTQGTVMEILDRKGGKEEAAEWYKVRLNSSYVGWIEGMDFQPI